MLFKPDDTTLIITAVIGSVGPTIAVIVNIIINQRIAIKAQEARESAKITASRRFVETKKLADENMNVTQATHTLVNGQRDGMLHLIASLSHRIAEQNPTDKAAQLASVEANEAAELSTD